MIINLTRTLTFKIDTGPERKRIAKDFKRNPEMQRKLTRLMDLIETGQWDKAKAAIDGKWWCGRDRDTDNFRAEYIGCFSTNHEACVSYTQLIYRMTGPIKEEFKVVSVTKTP